MLQSCTVNNSQKSLNTQTAEVARYKPARVLDLGLPGNECFIMFNHSSYYLVLYSDGCIIAVKVGYKSHVHLCLHPGAPVLHVL